MLSQLGPAGNPPVEVAANIAGMPEQKFDDNNNQIDPSKTTPGFVPNPSTKHNGNSSNSTASGSASRGEKQSSVHIAPSTVKESNHTATPATRIAASKMTLEELSTKNREEIGNTLAEAQTPLTTTTNPSAILTTLETENSFVDTTSPLGAPVDATSETAISNSPELQTALEASSTSASKETPMEITRSTDKVENYDCDVETEGNFWIYKESLVSDKWRCGRMLGVFNVFFYNKYGVCHFFIH